MCGRPAHLGATVGGATSPLLPLTPRSIGLARSRPGGLCISDADARNSKYALHLSIFAEHLFALTRSSPVAAHSGDWEQGSEAAAAVADPGCVARGRSRSRPSRFQGRSVIDHQRRRLVPPHHLLHGDSIVLHRHLYTYHVRHTIFVLVIRLIFEHLLSALLLPITDFSLRNALHPGHPQLDDHFDSATHFPKSHQRSLPAPTPISPVPPRSPAQDVRQRGGPVRTTPGAVRAAEPAQRDPRAMPHFLHPARRCAPALPDVLFAEETGCQLAAGRSRAIAAAEDPRRKRGRGRIEQRNAGRKRK